MTGRERLLAAMRNEYTERAAWLPFVGVHGGKLIGQPADRYLRSAEAIAAGLRRARELYRPDGLPVVFDLQLEAEALGCELKWAEKAPPSVVSHPLEAGRSLSDLPVFDPSMGRFPIVLDALDRVKAEMGQEVALLGLICGPFTLALHLMGNGIFLQMFDHPDYIKAVIGFCAAVGQKAAQAWIEHGADAVAVVDPMTSQISPDHFTSFVSPALDTIIDFIHAQGRLGSLFVCGDATRNLEAMCRTAADNICVDENIALETLRDMTRPQHKSFGGNLRLTSALLLGDEDDARLDAIRCLDIGGACGFILAPGCDLPYDVPERNLQAVAEMVHDSYRREVAKRTIVAKTASEAAQVALPDYAKEPLVIVDVITLDSASCAPCQYMVNAVQRAAQRLSRPIVIREHRISTREGLAAMSRLGVRHVPTICIDGETVFSSIIPDQQTLITRLEAAIARKGTPR